MDNIQEVLVRAFLHLQPEDIESNKDLLLLWARSIFRKESGPRKYLRTEKDRFSVFGALCDVSGVSHWDKIGGHWFYDGESDRATDKIPLVKAMRDTRIEFVHEDFIDYYGRSVYDALSDWYRRGLYDFWDMYAVIMEVYSNEN